MKLSRLELSGFKSFAGTTVLDFPIGVTAIVGPNGSGKSNIADAIQWVLGEQSSRNMRVKKSEDLIFAGSDHKTRLSRASVFLHLNGEQDYQQGDLFVLDTLGRKIFRDGSGSYYINGKQSRLKDVAEVIAHAHINADFGVISQKKGDSVLDLSARARRLFMEEAIGIKEYRLKKDEATTKLSQTNDNIISLQVLMAELKPHYLYLEREYAKLAQRKKAAQDLAAKEEEWSSAKYQLLMHQHAQTTARLQTLTAQRTDLSASIAKDREHLAREQQHAHADFDSRKTDALLMRKNALLRDLGAAEGKLSALKDQKKIITTFVDKEFIIRHLEDLRKSIDALLADVKAGKSAFMAVSKRITDLADLVRKGKIERTIGTVAQDGFQEAEIAIAALKKELQDIDGNIAIAHKERAQYEAEWQKMKDAILKIERRIQEQTITLRAGENDLREAQSRADYLDREIAQLREAQKINTLSAARTAEKSSLTRSAEEVRQLEQEVMTLRARLAALGEGDESVEKSYLETKKRYETLTAELDDLQKSSASLHELLAKLNKEIEQEFKKNVVRVRKYFGEYFQFIFGGGACVLEEVDLLPEGGGEESDGSAASRNATRETGLDISVTLPKKKPQGLLSISGGERALVSVAFLMSLIKAGKPPFLVLDEIDAPLDEANSLKFGEIVKGLASQTQFIVITHNRQTMQWADVLYGVSLNKDGISNLLSLKMEG